MGPSEVVSGLEIGRGRRGRHPPVPGAPHVAEGQDIVHGLVAPPVYGEGERETRPRLLGGPAANVVVEGDEDPAEEAVPEVPPALARDPTHVVVGLAPVVAPVGRPGRVGAPVRQDPVADGVRVATAPEVLDATRDALVEGGPTPVPDEADKMVVQVNAHVPAREGVGHKGVELRPNVGGPRAGDMDLVAGGPRDVTVGQSAVVVETPGDSVTTPSPTTDPPETPDPREK